ncbi:MAG: YaiO family outer membrane beta-barrel protein [Pseudomonadota bacterium]|nr:YaiO family outer membrane beta-barrel protein [Pseudomonadota bacterium]
MDLDVRTALARVRSWQRRFAAARRLYEAVLAEAPRHWEARAGLADTLFWSGNHQQALEHYRALLAAGYEPAQTRRRIRQVEAALAEAPAPAATEAGPALPYRDYVRLGLGWFAYSGGIDDERNGLLEAARPWDDRTLVARAEVLDRFGATDAQLSGELYSPLWKGAWGYAGASVGLDPTFVADWTLGGELYQNLGVVDPALSRLEASFGYRHLDFATGGVDILITGLTLYLPNNVWITEKLYHVPDTDSSTLSSQLTWRPGRRLELRLSGAFGTAAERVTAADDVLRTDTTSIQAGVTLPLSPRLSLEVWGTHEDREGLYRRRGGGLNLLFHW